MATTIGVSTKIWERNQHWTLYSQCGVWDSATRSVQVWECIRDHDSVPGTEPPNAMYWRFVARR
ncbi:hypothetical protein DFH07DRAFT_751947 [Mycena maculata]|uniref:Uncharacterized protein n=1 Tax=Mycena maculata TaxID=230809 RepID=A0AAD7N0B1_9AGAR|nr:hypothetical protein DFH07DRAFT_751947 [Mycena maculata]